MAPPAKPPKVTNSTMAPPGKGTKPEEISIRKRVVNFYDSVKNFKPDFKIVKNIFFDPDYFMYLASCLLVFEVFLNVYIIENVKYTEIDWKAYMQEVEGVVNGTYDYTKLKGDTGPLVYPAGFVYIFMGLYYLTNHGRNIKLAQYIFAALYILTLVLVFRILKRSKKIPPYLLLFICCGSYRIHSIYVLRLFNDPIAILFLYAAINFFISDCWKLGSVFYSLGVSVKMNVLLFAPALLLAYIQCLGYKNTFWNLFICATIQVLLALPFLLVNPVGYIQRSFDIGRVFLYEWTVNWRFLPEEVFLSKWFHVGLLVLHLGLIAFFAYTHWNRFLINYSTLHSSGMDFACQLFLLPMFMSNFIGIAASRSLHYQFYIWYFHSLPYLLWSTSFSAKWRLLILGTMEICWNTFPSTDWSSGLLQGCHILILAGLYFNRPTEKSYSNVSQKISQKSE